MVRLLTLTLFTPTPIEVQIHRKGKFPKPPGQLIDTVPVAVKVEPEIRSTEPNGMVVALIAHCAWAERVCASRNRAQKMAQRMDARRACSIDAISEWRSVQPDGLDLGLSVAELPLRCM